LGANTSGTTGRDWSAYDHGHCLGTKIVLGIAVAGHLTNAPLAGSCATNLTGGMELPRQASPDSKARVDLRLRRATPGEGLGQGLPGLLPAAGPMVAPRLLFQLLRPSQQSEMSFTPLPLAVMASIAAGEALRRGVVLPRHAEVLV
jgi:hypothetical protein